MRTHQTAQYHRKKGDKKRPVIARRPTLKFLGARLRVIGRHIRQQIAPMKPGQPANPFLEMCYRQRLSIQGYLSTLNLANAKAS